MKTKSFFGTLVFAGWMACCSNLSADPLNNWHWRNPLPNGNPQFGAQILNDIIFTNGTFFAVGNFGVVSTSIDGTNWTQTITATSNTLSGLVYASGKFVAVGVNGTVETSPDGTNWVLQNSGTTGTLSSVTYGKGKFVAVGTSTAISSPDGANWSQAVSGFPGGGANQVAGNSAGFVAVNGGTNAYFSPDGLYWTYQPLASAPGFNQFFANEPIQAQIVTSFNGSFVIGACKLVTSESYEMYMYTSADGNHWTTNDIGNAISLTSGFVFSYFMSGNPQMIAGSATFESFLQFSPDGVTWARTNISLSQMPRLYNYAGAYGNGCYVIVGPVGNFVSPDVVNWSKQQYNSPPAVGPTSTFNSIAYSNGTYVVATSTSFVVSTNDAVYTVESNTPSLSAVTAYNNGFVAVGSSGQIYQSTNGLAWYQHNSGTANNLHGIAAGNLLVAVGDNGAVQTSPTGIIWTSRGSGTSLALFGVVYSNGLYVAVGQQGTVVTSPDGINWTAQDSTVLNNLLSVTYGYSAGFLAVGVNATIVTSPDGINWTQQIIGNVGPLESATFGNGYYLVTGTNGLVLTSPDSVNWTSRNVGALGGQAFNGSGFFNGRFDVVGTSGTVLESDPVAPLFDLQMKYVAKKNIITAFATPGSSFRIISGTNLMGSSWSTAATFNNAAAISYWTNSTPAGTVNFYRLVSP